MESAALPSGHEPLYISSYTNNLEKIQKFVGLSIQSVLDFLFQSTNKLVLFQISNLNIFIILGQIQKFDTCSALCGMLFTSAHINSRFSSRIARALIRHFSTLGTENLDDDKSPKVRLISFLHFISWQA